MCSSFLNIFSYINTEIDICPQCLLQIWPFHALWCDGEGREELPGDVELAGAANGWGGQRRAGWRSLPPQLPGREPVASGLCCNWISQPPLTTGDGDSTLILNMIFLGGSWRWTGLQVRSPLGVCLLGIAHRSWSGSAFWPFRMRWRTLLLR